ncbi:MAG: hypothetical protein KAT34_09075 [Candidatus Aminicenantes bacterium]|nr:hypothetical protein [Candidatus Aminicenantes bacterium]
MRKSLVSLVVLTFSLGMFLLTPITGFGQIIQLQKTIKVDPDAELQVTPWNFCVTEDKIFLLPDYQAGKVKVFSENGSFLKFIRELGSENIGEEKMLNPMYCFYSRHEGKLGVFDYGARRLFIYKRSGQVEFDLIKVVDCQRLGYDMDFSGDGKQLIVSGYVTDKDNIPFDLYSINIETLKINEIRQINHLLPSYQKYGLADNEEFQSKYFTEQTLPAVGIKAFFDTSGDELFYVWEGALRVIKLNLRSKELTTFKHETLNYTKPNGNKLAESHKNGDLKTTWKKQKKYAYVRNIFATPRHVLLVYETATSNINNTSAIRMQIYNIEGKYIDEVLIPGRPGKQMWLDEDNELYAFSMQPGNNNKGFSILKYKINIK